jgi:hypothetical protein
VKLADSVITRDSKTVPCNVSETCKECAYKKSSSLSCYIESAVYNKHSNETITCKGVALRMFKLYILIIQWILERQTV